MNTERLLSDTLRAAPWGATAAAIMAAALVAVEPAAAVRASLRRDGDLLLIGERRHDLGQVGRVLLVGCGKAGHPMAEAAHEVLGARLTAGVVVVKEEAGGRRQEAGGGRQVAGGGWQVAGGGWQVAGGGWQVAGGGRQEAGGGRQEAGGGRQEAGGRWQGGGLDMLAAGHPVPDERSVAGARRIADLLADTRADDLVIALISGGGSALLSLPAPGLGLADLQALTGQLLVCGASIDEINTLRKHLDLIKGGGLARMAYPAALATLVLSDVVGSPLDVIASGPTVPDPSSFADALAVLDRYGLRESAPLAVIDRLRRGAGGELAETPGPDDPCFARADTLLVGDNSKAARAAEAAARAAGLNALILTTYLQGEARAAGRFLGAIGRELALGERPLPRPACLIVGGETTVTLRGDGRGGRNQELALAAVGELAGLPDIALITLASDGDDGPTDAAGAVVTGETLARARSLGLDPAAHLARNDAYPFFAALGDLLRPGPTVTNVNDLAFLFAW